MLNKGQWVKIISMQGEPAYSGKIGQVQEVDESKAWKRMTTTRTP